MILYDGIENLNSAVSILKFKNEKGSSVKILISKELAEQLSLQLEPLTDFERGKVERGNEEDSD